MFFLRILRRYGLFAAAVGYLLYLVAGSVQLCQGELVWSNCTDALYACRYNCEHP